MLESRVISEASFTFVQSESLWFVSIERDVKGFTFQVTFQFATMMSRANNWSEAEILSLMRRSHCATT